MKLRTDSGAIQEALDLLQEECGELVVEVSKVRRFGFDFCRHKTDITNREHLLKETADVLALIDILIEQRIMSVEELEQAKLAKNEKIKVWTNLYEQDQSK